MNNNIFTQPNQITKLVLDDQTIYIWNGFHYTKEQLEDYFNELDLVADTAIHRGFNTNSPIITETDKRLVSTATQLKKKISVLRKSLSLASRSIN